MDPDSNKTPQKEIFLKIKMNPKFGVFLGCYKLFVSKAAVIVTEMYLV